MTIYMQKEENNKIHVGIRLSNEFLAKKKNKDINPNIHFGQFKTEVDAHNFVTYLAATLKTAEVEKVGF